MLETPSPRFAFRSEANCKDYFVRICGFLIAALEPFLQLASAHCRNSLVNEYNGSQDNSNISHGDGVSVNKMNIHIMHNLAVYLQHQDGEFDYAIYLS